MGVDKTKEEWAKRHLAQMGNEEPLESSIQVYIDLITPGSETFQQFFLDQYNRWVARDEVLAVIGYDLQSEDASKKTLNERYIEDEDNDGPFWNQ